MNLRNKIHQDIFLRLDSKIWYSLKIKYILTEEDRMIFRNIREPTRIFVFDSVNTQMVKKLTQYEFKK